jgi:hypothetical protein
MALWLVIQRYENKPFKRIPLVVPYAGVIIGCISVVTLVSYLTTDIGLVQYWTHYVNFLWREHWFIVLLSIVSIGVALYKQATQLTLWLAGSFLLSLGVISYSLPLLQYRYLFFILPVLYVLTAYGISLVHNWYIGAAVVGFVLILSPGFIIIPQATYDLESDRPTSNLTYKSFTPQPDFEAAYTVIAQHNPDILITPYPTISRLYNEVDTAAIYVDLTGTIKNSPKVEVYTGVPYIHVDELRDLVEQGDAGIILIDFFAERRMQPELRTYIETYSEEIYANTSGPWSRITLYSFDGN